LLDERYRQRKEQLLALLRRSVEGDAARIEWDVLILDLHRIAGVAGHFGEEGLGDTARRLETRLRLVSDPVERLRDLRKAWPLFVQLA
jgi:HPt (histidine-containing phosphotransfer) domain-containing protein